MPVIFDGSRRVGGPKAEVEEDFKGEGQPSLMIMSEYMMAGM